MAILMRNLVQTNKQRTTWGAAKGVGAPVLAWLLFLSLPFAAATGSKRFASAAVNFTTGQFAVRFGDHQGDDNPEIELKKMSVNISLEEAFTGTSFWFEYDRMVWSHACTRYGVCAACGGTGVRMKEVKQLEPYTVSQTTHSCPMCGGKKHLHVSCAEPTRQRQRARVLVELQPRLNSRTTMIFANAGDESLPQREPRQFGDLQLAVKLESTDEVRSLSLHDFDLVKSVHMNARMALEGFEVEFEHLDGSRVIVNRTGKLTLPGSELVVPGKGMPIPSSDRAGSLRLRFDFAKLKELDGEELFASQAVCSTEDEARACEAGNPGQVEAEDAAYIHELLLRRALHDIADKLLREER